MKWEHSGYLWFLTGLPLFVWFVIYTNRNKQKMIEKFVNLKFKDQILKNYSKSRDSITIFNLAIVLLLLILALARPQWGFTFKEIFQKMC